MHFSSSAVYLGLASLVASAQGCLILSGTLNFDNTLTLTLFDNNQSVCIWSGKNTGGPTGLYCATGFAAWVQLGTFGSSNAARGTARYSTGHGANNYAFDVTNSRNQDTRWVIDTKNYGC